MKTKVTGILALCVFCLAIFGSSAVAGEKLQVVASPKAPEAIGAYSQAIAVGDFVFTSGTLPIDPANGKMPDGIKAQTTQALENIKVILEEAGTGMDKVVKSTIFLADINDFAVFNEVYSTYFKAPYPARCTLAVKDVPRGALIEIDVIAVK